MIYALSIHGRLGGLLRLAVLMMGVIAVAPSIGWSQSTGTANEALEQQYEEAFQVLFQDPGNLEKTFKFAELAVEIGNFETAISSLERMLLVNPDLPRVRLELGVLYFRLGSYQIAKHI